MKKLSSYLLPILVPILAIQLIRPARTNPPIDPARTIDARVSIPPDVRATLGRACRDCHSNETRWPWYSNVAPVAWLLVSDVNAGRSRMNFSEWDLRAAQPGGPDFGQICLKVRMGEMPLWAYRLMHPDAHLSASDVDAICAWTKITQENR